MTPRRVKPELTIRCNAERMRLLVFVLLLAACNTPGAHFRGLPKTTVTIDGSTFDVRVNGRLAEALRTNPEYAPRFGPIRDRAKWAMELVSGCIVKKVGGDQSLATGILDCGDGGPPLHRMTPAEDLACFTADSYVSPATKQLILDLDCAVL